MADEVRLYIPVAKVPDGQSFSADVQCKDAASGADSAPSTLEFRVDCLTNNVLAVTWTSLVAGASASVAVASDWSAIITAANPFEVKQITVTADRGLPSQCSTQKRWVVTNLNLGP